MGKGNGLRRGSNGSSCGPFSSDSRSLCEGTKRRANRFGRDGAFSYFQLYLYKLLELLHGTPRGKLEKMITKIRNITRHLKSFLEAQVKEPKDLELKYNTGNSYYKMKEYDKCL